MKKMPYSCTFVGEVTLIILPESFRSKCMTYNHSEIEKNWQKSWTDSKAFEAHNPKDAKKPKYYVLDMFPYPSGAGLHAGHLACYVPSDIMSRYKRAKGFNVLHPFGYDAFGLPAEQYAIQTGIHPSITTEKAIDNFRRQVQAYGCSYDWSREISTCDPEYYKWTQFIFLKLYEKGLAYQKEAPVNWCPALKTVLANEEVVDGKSERGGHPVVRVKMRQWMLKITAYAERLLNDLDKLDWLEATKNGQRNWIGKSEGANVRFEIENKTNGSLASAEVFTTRPDTIFGASFLVLAPEHPLVTQITTADQKKAVDEYVDRTSRKSEVDRKAAQEKTGVFTGSYAKNPFHPDTKIPVWIADYVLLEYGTGAIMAVPGHDERDYEFAKKFDLPILRVLDGGGELPMTGDGKLVNSDFLNGLEKDQAIQKAIGEVEKRKLGTRQVQYKLRDWLFSRQRYWGEPIPMKHLADGKTVPLTPDELPLTLPEVADYEPSDAGEPPLARVASFVNRPDGAKHDANTMPGSAGSSWYFLRFTDPHNSQLPFAFDAQKYWMPVDLYVGGAEHTVGHLLYARFWQKVLFDCGLVSHDEPFQKLVHQGVIMGPDGYRMSKSRGNTVNIDDIREKYGADATRAYVAFMGPFDKDKPWDTSGIEGVKRFLDRVWRLGIDDEGAILANDTEMPDEAKRLMHKTIKKVDDDLNSMNFNTAISAMMIFVNELYRLGIRPKQALKTLAQLLMPIAPHFAEELWHQMGAQGLVSSAAFPGFDPSLISDATIEIGVQVNGKIRGSVQLAADAPEAAAMEAALALAPVKNAIGSLAVKKVIYKAGKILNIIVG
jgi:leucyl-tRNA synthetase